jgi:hypothetical protein
MTHYVLLTSLFHPQSYDYFSDTLLDRIEGIQRSPRLKRAASWAWSNKELFIFVGSLAFLAGYVWWFWGGITDSLSTLSPKRPHPWLDAVLGSNHVLTILLVWFPIGAFFTFLFLAAIVGDTLAVAILLGFSPRSNRQKTSARSGASGWAKIVEWLAEWGLGVFACWILFVMIYAKKESGAFFSLFDQLNGAQVWIVFGLFGAWIPLVFIAQAVQRRREKNRSKLGQPTP